MLSSAQNYSPFEKNVSALLLNLGTLNRKPSCQPYGLRLPSLTEDYLF